MQHNVVHHLYVLLYITRDTNTPSHYYALQIAAHADNRESLPTLRNLSTLARGMIQRCSLQNCICDKTDDNHRNEMR